MEAAFREQSGQEPNEAKSSQPILAVLDDLRAGWERTDEEETLLNSLVQRYQEREDKSRQG